MILVEADSDEERKRPGNGKSKGKSKTSKPAAAPSAKRTQLKQRNERERQQEKQRVRREVEGRVARRKASRMQLAHGTGEDSDAGEAEVQDDAWEYDEEESEVYSSHCFQLLSLLPNSLTGRTTNRILFCLINIIS